MLARFRGSLFFLFLTFALVLSSTQAGQTSRAPSTPQHSTQADTPEESEPEKDVTDVMKMFTGMLGKKVIDTTQNIRKNQSTTNISEKELQQVIKLLQDNVQREKIIKVLKALTTVEEVQKKSKGFSLPDTIIRVTGASAEVIVSLFTATLQLPQLIWSGIKHLSDPDQRIEILYLLSLVFLGLTFGFSVEWLINKFLKQFSWSEIQEISLRKMPYYILHDTIPVICFGLIAYGFLFIGYNERLEEINHPAYIALTAVIMLRTTWQVLMVLVTSRNVELSIASHSAHLTTYKFIIAVLQVLTIGIVFAITGHVISADKLIYTIWLRILGFGVVGLSILAMWKTRQEIRTFFKYDQEHTQGVSLFYEKITDTLANYWHIFYTIMAIISYVLWLGGATSLARHTLHALLLTILSGIILVLSRYYIVLWVFHLLIYFQKTSGPQAKSQVMPMRAALINSAQFIIYTIFYILLCQIWGIDLFALLIDEEIKPYVTSMISTAIILAIIRFLWVWVDYIARARMRPKMFGRKLIEPTLFTKTSTPILRSVARWVLVIIAIILIMEEFGIPIMPIIYGISVIGIAISLGAQSLVKDLINGILTLMEGNIAVGEVVTIGAFTGAVESLSLRGVLLRHANGAIQTIAFSEITNIINRSRDYTVVPIELQVPYGTELEKIHTMLKHTFDILIQDEAISNKVIAPITISGVDRFSELGFFLTASFKISPDPRNRIGKTFNTLLKNSMEEFQIFPPKPLLPISPRLESS